MSPRKTVKTEQLGSKEMMLSTANTLHDAINKGGHPHSFRGKDPKSRIFQIRLRKNYL